MKERRLTEKEEKRLVLFDNICKEKAEQGYTKTDLTVEANKANILGTIYAAILCLPFLVLFFLFNKIGEIPDWVGSWLAYLFIIIGLLIAVVVHELIHGITWSVGTKNHWKSIDFGVLWKTLNPYCTCVEPLTRKTYILGGIMPGFVLGIIPSIVSIFIGNFVLLFFGLLMILSAGGDLLILLQILKHKTNKTALYLDHPTEIGLVCFEKN